LAFTTAPLSALRTAGRADLTDADRPVVALAEQASHVALLGADDTGTAELMWLPRGCVHLRAVAGGAWPAVRVGSAGIPMHAAAVASPTQARCIALPGLSLAEVQGRAALLSAAQIAGALGRLLEMTVTYTSERVQFGRSIGQFQAVQHQLAQLAEEAAAARVAVQAAAATEDPRWFVAAAAAAKVRAGEAAGLGSRIAHQLDGAVGITAEHTLHLYTRRLRECCDEHGSKTFWARALVQAVRQGGERSAWQAVVACTSR